MLSTVEYSEIRVYSEPEQKSKLYHQRARTEHDDILGSIPSLIAVQLFITLYDTIRYTMSYTYINVRSKDDRKPA